MTTTEYQLILKMVKSFVEELKENSLILTRGVILLSCCTNVPIIKLLLASKSIYNGGIFIVAGRTKSQFLFGRPSVGLFISRPRSKRYILQLWFL